MELVRENFVKGLRSFKDYGFAGYHHWVTPYGVNDIDLRNLAKEYNILSLIKMSANMTTKELFTPRGALDRYDIPRYTFSASSVFDSYKGLINACAEANGLLLVVSHVNTWDNTTTLDNKLSDHIQYAIDNGVKVANYLEAFEDWKALFYMNEIFK